MIGRVGLVGLGAMGRGLAGNLRGRDVGVVAWDKQPPDAALKSWTADSGVDLSPSLQALVGALAPPRCILLSIPGGAPVDEVLDALLGWLQPGDVVADCSNAHFRDTARRERLLAAAGMHLLGLGISGGPAGARHGPAIMAGGSPAAWRDAAPLFAAMAARAGDEPCCAYFGDNGAGHLVKMVHNGIEYAVMHLLTEACAVLQRAGGQAPDRIAAILDGLAGSAAAGYLTTATARVVAARTADDRGFLMDAVDGAAGQTGTGRWTVETALELGVAVPTLAEAVMARSLSGVARPLAGAAGARPTGNPGLETLLPQALALAFASAFVQGLAVCAAAEALIGRPLDRVAVLRVWRQGCILRGAMVERLLTGAAQAPDQPDLFSTATVRALIADGLGPLRRLVSAAVGAGVPAGGLASALAYVEAMTGNGLPTALIQMQRDFFGRHGLRDRETGRSFHGPWADAPDEP